MNLPTTADIAAVMAADDTARRAPPRSVVIVCDRNPGISEVEALRRHFELNSILPDWNGSDALPSTGRLVITRINHPRVFGTRLATYPIKQALRMAGVTA